MDIKWRNGGRITEEVEVNVNGEDNKRRNYEKARELARMIAETEEVDFFKQAEAQINENQKVREKIANN